MRAQKRKGGGPGKIDDFLHGMRRREIENDVFELWVGISRLMARVYGSYGRFDADIPGQPPGRRPPGIRRS